MIVCGTCGQANIEGSTFCTRCNAFLEWDGQRVSGAAGGAANAGGAVLPQGQAGQHDAHPERRSDPTRAVLATLSQGVQSVEPGGQVVFTLEVRNLGDVVDELSIEVLGDAAAWAEVQPPSINLMPATAGAATIRIRPPRTPQVRSGWVNFGIGIRSRQHPESSVVERGAIDVAPFTDSAADLAPRLVRGPRGATFAVRARNNGNTPVSATLTMDDPEQALDFEATPAVLQLEPGAAKVASVRLRARRTFWLGAAKSRMFQVSVAPAGQPLRTLDGTFVQRGVLPVWAAGVAALLVAGSALGAGMLMSRGGLAEGTPQTSPAAFSSVPPASPPAVDASPSPSPRKTRSPSPSLSPSPSPSASPSPSPSPSPAPSPSSIAASLRGTWKNVDPNTRDIVEVDVAGTPDTLTIRDWGACSPSPCDWGTQSIPMPAGAAAYDVTFTFSFAVVTQHHQPNPDGTLTVVSATHFTDGSGRTDFTSTDGFAKSP